MTATSGDPGLGRSETATGDPLITVVAEVVIADDRPLVRAGLRTILAASRELAVTAAVPHADVVDTVGEHGADVAVIAIREQRAEPFAVIAELAEHHPSTRVLTIADAASVLDLRSAVIAGTASFLLSTASEEELRQAVVATAAGEGVVSPAIAMQLAGSWRSSAGPAGQAPLTPRELEVLQWLAEGLTNQEIGGRLDLSARTVKTHVQNLLAKLDVPDRTGAVARGFRTGMIR